MQAAGSAARARFGVLRGQFAIEFALQGSRAVGIEGREANVAKAQLRVQQLGLANIELVCGDVRDLRRERFGGFDAVLCLGLLYHLDFPDVIRFLERVAEVCDHVAVFDTHINLGMSQKFRDGQRTYRGREYVEHSAHAKDTEREQSRWASLDNTTSVWFTRASLMNALMDAGFTSVFECEVPAEPEKPLDRRVVVAVKGQHVALRSSPGVQGRAWGRVPERRSRALLVRNHAPGTNLLKRLLLDVERLRERRSSAGYGPRSYGRRR